jgi:hypothetical protein
MATETTSNINLSHAGQVEGDLDHVLKAGANGSLEEVGGRIGALGFGFLSSRPELRTAWKWVVGPGP